MKRIDIFRPFVAAFAALALFASCEKDNPGGSTPEPEPKAELVSLDVMCYYETSQDVLDFYDVTSAYAVGTEGAQTQSLNTTTIVINKRYDKDNLPKSISFKVTMNPKSEHKQIEPETGYKLHNKYHMSVKGTYSDGKTKELKESMNEINMTIKGAKWEEYLAKGQRKGCDLEYKAE